MRHWLAAAADQGRTDWMKRFTPRCWLVDFPRPMMAAVTTQGADAMTVDTVFLRGNDLAGLIWDSVDRHSHPLLAYETSRDYRGTRLAFRWQSQGVMPLDAVNGPVLTIEGRDAAGNPRGWYVRLWNYALGAPDDAEVSLDFDALAGGFLLPGEADPVWAGDIDRMFISLVPPAYDGIDAPLPAPVVGQVRLTDMRCDGSGSVLAVGDAFVPPHRLRLCSGYDDSYNQTPERLIEAMFAMGYRGALVHYVGMSHFPGLAWDAASSAFVVDPAVPVTAPALAWHADFLARAVALGFSPILSLSFELLDQHCPGDWAQRDMLGQRSATGYAPPSALLSPANAAAMAWLQTVALAFMMLSVDAGAPPRFQIGEPWWWVGPGRRPCLYDVATTALYLAETGQTAPSITDTAAVSTVAERDYLDWCGRVLGQATLALRDAVRSTIPACEVLLLFFAPQVLDAASPELIRANMPDAWAWPAFDVLQLEDYDFVTGGDFGGQQRGRRAVTERLGYPLAQQHYFSGFALTADDWPAIAAAADQALATAVADTFVWAWPQVARDGFVAFEIRGDAGMADFHDVRFPLQPGFGASGGPVFSTQIVVTGSGHEQRNSQWSDALVHYDAGVGIRSEADLAALLAFFRARRGQAHGFRFRDPIDHGSALLGQAASAVDQHLGNGDGGITRFALVKHYGDGGDVQTRRITRPDPATVRVAIDGLIQVAGWQLGPMGHVDFDTPPPPGSVVTAGYEFDVPVRFDADHIDVSIAGWRAGDLPSVPLIELREV